MATGDRIPISRRGEIDTRAPFRSVKEAVSLFGERVLAGEVYAGKCKENKQTSSQHKEQNSKLGNMTTELEETKQNLKKAREDTMGIAHCLSSLQEELERTRRELQELKLERESQKQMVEFEFEDLKFVEGTPNAEMKPPRCLREEVNIGAYELQKKRYVTFSNPPLSQVVMPQNGPFLERHPSLKKKKKKPMIPLIGGIFSRLKKSSEVASARSP